MSVWVSGRWKADGEGTPDWLVTISFGPRLIEKRVENCIGQQRGNVLGQPAKYSLGLIKHDQPQAADKGTTVRNRAEMDRLPSVAAESESKRESELELGRSWSRVQCDGVE